MDINSSDCSHRKNLCSADGVGPTVTIESAWFRFRDKVMRILSLLLLLSGWFLVLAAIAWLRPGFLAVFAIAGVMVELLGLGLLARSYTPLRGQERQF
jgi:hypothetical protein